MKRTLTIQATGDLWRDRQRRVTRSALLLRGIWLAQAGFPPGAQVEVQTAQPGEITLRVCRAETEAPHVSPDAGPLGALGPAAV